MGTWEGSDGERDSWEYAYVITLFLDPWNLA